MAEELNALRDKIDAVDKQLIDLLAACRLALVGKWGSESRHGLPIYAPDREASMLARRRAEAEALGCRGPYRGRAAPGDARVPYSGVRQRQGAPLQVHEA